VPLGVHQKIARHPDNSLIWPTSGSWRQFGNRRCRDVYADNGEVTVVEFPNVGTPIATGALSAVGVRIGAEPFQEHI
jgi:hypothetical protein